MTRTARITDSSEMLPVTPSAAEIGHSFLTSLAAADGRRDPYSYWLLKNPLPERTIEDICALPIAAPAGLSFYGKRESNNASRVYFNPENQKKHAVCQEIAQAFSSENVLAAIKAETGADVGKGRLRIEYCQDTDGFWLEPHVDISVKLFTMLVYLSDDPALYDAGTDIYDDTPDHNLVARAPYERNKGLVFIPGKNTWHGLSKRRINGLRRSIIVNYVTPDWHDTWELC